MHRRRPAMAFTAAFAALQLSPSVQADGSYLYMIPSILSMGMSIYQQERAMAMQQEMQRRQLESLRVQQNHPQPASAAEIAELTRLLREQQKQIEALQKQIESYRTMQGHP
jgi:septal ring factor EnvC (AmiA/AmiB activator)